MVSIDNVDKISFRARMKKIEKSQIPFAAAKALTDTAKEIWKEEAKQLESRLSKPTPFTKKAFLYKIATKRMLIAKVYAKDIQAQYLHYQVEGGVRRPEQKALKLPVHIKLNKYGNLTRKRVPNMLKNDAKFFSGTPTGWSGAVPGIYKRVGGKRNPKLQLQVYWGKKAKYDKKFPFYDIANKVVQDKFRKKLSDAIDYAMRTK